MKSYMKEKQIYCGNYLEVDIIPTGRKMKQRRGRKKRRYLSAPKQRNLNDKNARRYFIQLVNTNFTNNDMHITCTYDRNSLPPSIEEAERIVGNFLRRLSYRMKKIGLSLKYILVTEFGASKATNKVIRVHHHIIINQGLSRDEVEALWCHRKKKGEKQGKRIGFVNADRLQTNEYGLEALARYLTKQPNGKKRWSSSTNLDKPYYTESTNRYSKRKTEELAKCPDDREFWEKKYKGYVFTECKPVFNEVIGKWSLYIKMRRYEEW